MMRHFPKTFSLGVLTVCLAFPMTAQAQMGSPGHGETQAIALHPDNPLIMFAGAAKGFCVTRSGGKDNWPSSGLETFSPREIAVSRSNPSLIYTGTYEMGMYRTRDMGKSWEAINTGLINLKIRALALHPDNDSILWAGTDGDGIFKSVDGGNHWKAVNVGLFDKVIRCLVIHPDDPMKLYAGTWNGFYKSIDGGNSWTMDPQGLYDVDVTALAIDPVNPDNLYAATVPRGIYRSEDGGRSWKPGKVPLMEIITCLAIDPNSRTDLYAGTRAGVFVSTDSGISFTSAGLRWSNMTWDLVFDGRTSPSTLYYAGVGGVLKTSNRGLWWEVTGPKRN